jgi:PhoH-like ATPase
MPRKPTTTQSSNTKIFVLDTSVILHDHHSVQHFHEHDVAIPITVLEEVDNFKKGNDTKNFEAREFIRFLDKLSEKSGLNEWIPIGEGATGKLQVVMPLANPKKDAQEIFMDQKADHRILNTALFLQEQFPDRQVILVSKDINLRIKAKSLNLSAEDYKHGKIQEIDAIYTGKTIIDPCDTKIIDALYKDGWTTVPKDFTAEIVPNHFYILRNGSNSVMAMYKSFEERLVRIDRRSAYGVKPKNAEQAFALQAVLDDSIRLVTLQGVAGTGKTLLALAGALETRRNFKQIFLARPIVPLSNKDIGFLPGDIKSKINPYMEPLFDNLKFIQNQYHEGDTDYQNITTLLENEKLIISPLAYIRGRSFSNICFIVDEAQNLTPHEVKTIITRAGQGTKIIFTGDIFQIDTPYLDTQSNGLSYLIERLKGQPLFAHITLERGERSDLANLANELL